jgi:hypothetical protein
MIDFPYVIYTCVTFIIARWRLIHELFNTVGIAASCSNAGKGKSNQAAANLIIQGILAGV